MSDADYLFALELQKRLNAENAEDSIDIEEVVQFKAPAKEPLRISNAVNEENEFLNQTQNLVHPQWEVLDPTPDIHSLFGAFDGKFFQSKLKCVTLEWSKKMYSCAGICYSRSNRFGQAITIRLSEPLLKLRPRKNLVETMLHEMIHAYCFVLHIREGNGGHGPNFKKIMNAINQVAGTNITVYHTFRDEVELYKQHVWRCNGICQHRAPFFGYVKRTSNRAPGPNDQWWAAHQETCGGYFQKIQEPEKKKKSSGKAKEQKPAGTGDMRKYLVPSKASDTKPVSKIPNNTATTTIKGFDNLNNGVKGPVKVNGGGTMLLNPKAKSITNQTSTPPSNSIAKAFPPSSYPGLSSDPFNTTASTKKPATRPVVGGNLRNVKGFRDLNSSGSDSGGSNGISSGRSFADTSMNGKGYSLDSSGSGGNINKVIDVDAPVDRNHLRNVWAKRFGGGDDNKSEKKDKDKDKADKRETSPVLEGNSKRRRLSAETGDVIIVGDVEPKKNQWLFVDDDIMLKESENEIIALSSDDEDDCSDSSSSSTRIRMPPRRHMTANERQIIIKKEIMDETIDLKDEDIVLIDDEYDDAQDNDLDLTMAAELADTTIIDEFFGDDTLLREFKSENYVRPSGSRYVHNIQEDIITCPICQGKMQRRVFDEHLDGCTGISIRVKPPVHRLKNFPMPEARPQRKSKPSKKNAKEILRKAGYSEADLLNITSESSTDDDDWGNGTLTQAKSPQTSIQQPNKGPKAIRQRSIYKTTRQCPACAKEIEEEAMNEHLDECLDAKRRGRRNS